MRVWYIVPKDVWNGIIDPQHGLRGHDLMHGSSYVELDETHILLATDFAQSNTWAEEQWHDHPEVARLAHPIHEANVPLSHLHLNAEHDHKQFKKHHHDRLKQAFGIEDHHTLWDLHERIKKHYPGIRLQRY